MPAVFTDLLTAVQEAVQARDLEDIVDRNIVCLKVPIDRRQNFPSLPGVLIAPFGPPRINPREGTNGRDDIHYPIVIATVQASNQDQSRNLDRHMTWQQSIRKLFINQRINHATGLDPARVTSLASVCTAYVDHRDSFNTAAFLKGYDAGAMIIRFLSRETRG